MARRTKVHDPVRDIVEVASAAYPDDLILSYYDEPTKDWGDSLAQFVAREIASVCSGGDADAATFYQAAHALTRAADQMTEAAQALHDRASVLHAPAKKERKKRNG